MNLHSKIFVARSPSDQRAIDEWDKKMTELANQAEKDYPFDNELPDPEEPEKRVA